MDDDVYQQRDAYNFANHASITAKQHLIRHFVPHWPTYSSHVPNSCLSVRTTEISTSNTVRDLYSKPGCCFKSGEYGRVQ
jgi:hypothetical protein